MADSSTYDYATIQRRQKVAEAMLAESSKPQKIEHWAQGLAQLGNVGADAYNLNRLDKQAAQAKKSDRDALMTLLGGGTPDASPAPAAPSPAPMMPAPAASSAGASPPEVLGAAGKPVLPDAQGVYGADATMLPQSGPDYGRAISSIESGGQKAPYSAIGPATKNGARAIGKYQVMDFNVPTWTKEILGQEMTPQQFAASPEAQEAVFKGKFGQYVQQTGSPQDAASMWFTGKPLAQGAGRADVNGMTGQRYADQFTKNLGPQSGPAAVAAAMAPGASPMAFSPDVAGQPAPGAPAPAPATGPAAVAQAMTAPAGKTAIGNGGSLVNIPPAQRAAIVSGLNADPGTPAHAVAMAMLTSAVKPQEFGFQTLPDGTILRTDPRSGSVAPVYQAPSKPTFGVIGKDKFGNDVHGFVDPFKQTATPYQLPGSTSAPETMIGPDGKPIAVPAGSDPKKFRDEITKINADVAGGKNTEVQAKSEKFGNKMELAEKNIQGLEDQGQSISGRGKEYLPGGNLIQAEKYQKFKQARDNFITALLRDESGAAIGTSEFVRYEKELFPQPGDSDGVVAQKREARRVALEAMKKAAGPGYKSPTFDTPTGNKTKTGVTWSIE